MTAAPRRLQRRRVKGWRKPEGAVIVNRTSRWGNPFRVGAHLGHPWNQLPWTSTHVRDRADAARLYELWARATPGYLDLARRALAGRDLVCPCPPPEPGEPDHCHAAVQIRLVNSEETPNA